MYTGLNDIRTEGRYVWAHNGEPVGNFFPWGDPAPHKDQEDCVAVDSKPNNWNDVPCTFVKPFMCEYT